MIYLLADSNLDSASNAIKNMLSQIWPYLVGIGIALIAFWALFCGIKFIAARSQEQQKEAKQQIRNFIIGVVAIFVLAVVASALTYFLKDWSESAIGGMSSVSVLFPVAPKF